MQTRTLLRYSLGCLLEISLQLFSLRAVCSAWVPGGEEEEEEEAAMLLPPWSADPGPPELVSATSSPGMPGRDEWRRPAAFVQIISSKTIWEVALTSKEKRRPRETPWAIVTGRVPAARGRCLGMEARRVSINRGEGPSILLHGNSPLSIWLIFWWGFNTFNENLKVLRDGINAGQA